MTSWTCFWCGEDRLGGAPCAATFRLDGTHAEIRARIEEHLSAHSPLKPCLGARAFGCPHRTNAYESKAPGYCVDCADDPRWKPVT